MLFFLSQNLILFPTNYRVVIGEGVEAAYGSTWGTKGESNFFNKRFDH